ncbi:hypothetical protein GA0116948_10840 [Chitinophaga costaii]|uniref:HmuY protein n=1 Tax=Chitinophaga costaii TaxID=1335309 RepID=A0A1C4EE40_9BACT|nr:HmuY family protein [Chitinophaga costaii]PUZ23886.1 hypothetical protein DCM91_13930 [Chitinophaga costaii]SCC41824.1 hypothetical protein GA0116948_10840 [Chitinophaga costaii]
MIKYLLFTGIVCLATNAQAQDIKTLRNINASQGTTYLDLQHGDTVSSNRHWDIALFKTTLSVNEPAILLHAKFEELVKAPDAPYQTDSDTLKAIPTGSGKGWYQYNMEEHTITPLPDKVIVLKVDDQTFIKLQIESYYKDGKPWEAGAYYTLRYAILH